MSDNQPECPNCGSATFSKLPDTLPGIGKQMYGILRCVECDTVFTYLISKAESERQGDNPKG